MKIGAYSPQHGCWGQEIGKRKGVIQQKGLGSHGFASGFRGDRPCATSLRV
jgi:hypothetical protein